MIPALLAQIGVPVLADILGNALNRIDHPAANTASRALGDLNTLITQGQITTEQISEANRHTEAMAQMQTDLTQSGLKEINQSLRMEITSKDIYVRRMRPTFGYIMALTWGAQMFGLAYVIIFRTSEAAIVIQAMASLGMIWTIGLSVLGIYVHNRTQEKKLGLNNKPTGIEKSPNSKLNS